MKFIFNNSDVKDVIKEYLDNMNGTDNNYTNILEQLNLLVKLFDDNNYDLNLDDAIEFINYSDGLNKLIKLVYSQNKQRIEKHGLESINLQNSIITMIEAYFIINDIEIVKIQNTYYNEGYLTDDVYKDYVSKLRRVELSKEDEHEILREIKSGDKKQRDMFVENNLLLVISIAKRYVGYGLDFMDLIQEGNMGLIKAIERFDINKGYRFSTYATHWIRSFVARSIANESRLIRIPAHRYEKYVKYSMIRNNYISKFGIEPTIKEMSEYSGIPEDDLMELSKLSELPVSLNSKINNDGEESNELELLVPDNYSLEDEVEKKLSIEEIITFMNYINISEKHIKILLLRYGFYDGHAYTLREIGEMYNVTRERIRQIVNSTLKKIRKSIHLEYIKNNSKGIPYVKSIIKK